MSSSNNPDSKKSLVFDYEKQDQAGISDVKYHNIITIILL